MMKLRKKYIAVMFICVIAILGTVFLSSKIGYYTTIKYRGFSEVETNIYFDNNFDGNKAELIDIINRANERVESFFGDRKGKPIIIISSDSKKLKNLGYTGSPALTSTYVLNGAHNFVIVSPDGLDIDVLAHELTHAELHERLYKGKLFNPVEVPIWFDEGVAMQNDYREKYDEGAFRERINEGLETKKLDSIKSSAQFFDSDKDVRVDNFIICKHELSEWITKNGIAKLNELIDRLNKGENFDGLY